MFHEKKYVIRDDITQERSNTTLVNCFQQLWQFEKFNTLFTNLKAIEHFFVCDFRKSIRMQFGYR